MDILLVGGPYDGRRIWAQHLHDHTVVLHLKSHDGDRRFIYLPEPADWEEVLAGRMKLDDSRAYHYYELVLTPAGPCLEFDGDRQRYYEAIRVALRDMPDRDGELIRGGPSGSKSGPPPADGAG